ncbi:MAG: hypothetical protein NVSMB9_18250 [Isosphaeraceae bacterium]
MSMVRTLARAALVWGAITPATQAEGIVRTFSQGSWTYYSFSADPSRGTGDPFQFLKLIKDNYRGVAAPIQPQAASPSPDKSPVPADPVLKTAPVETSRASWSTASTSATTATFGSGPSATSPGPAPLPIISSINTTSVSASDHIPNATTTPSSPIAPKNAADAFLDFRGALGPDSQHLISGEPHPWYTSPTVAKVFGGNTPTPQQQEQFAREVLDHVGHTFGLVGLSPRLTLDPSVPANHTLSVVSGASYGPNANAIGITDVGHDGYGFIDKLTYYDDPSKLAWAVAHNISHELMHAFGVAEHPDSTGRYLDAATASWDLLSNHEASFSPQAADLIRSTNFSGVSAVPSSGQQGLRLEGDQELVATVPEPTTLAGWSVLLSCTLYFRWKKSQRVEALPSQS